MHMAMHCHGCDTWFSPSLDTDQGEVLEKISGAGPWGALGDGETLEDQLFAELTSAQAICCPHCAVPVGLSEENLGRMSLQLLEQW